MLVRKPAATALAVLILAAAPTGAASGRDPAHRCGAPPRDPARALPYSKAAADCGYFTNDPKPEYAPSFLYEIPVVFHVIQSTSGAGFVSAASIASQIDILNEDFRALSGSNGAPGVDTAIRFRLATVDPSGNPTTGITYTTNNTWWNDGGTYWNTLAWDTHRYLNVYTNLASDYLGYVPDFPQSGGLVGQKSDRVVCLWSTIGKNAPYGPPYDQGRTATHEIGHYLGLYHTFDGGCASAANCHNNGDLICDTNPEANPNFDCPPTTSCGFPAPIRNYMDYTDDLCMWEFTAEQARRMRCTLQFWRPLLAEIVPCNPPYGSGCAGSGGFVPELSLHDCAIPGSSVTLEIAPALGGAQAFLFFGTNAAAIPLGFGCTLNASPLLPLALGPLPLAGAGPGNGALALPATVPPSAPLTLRMQAFVADPGVPSGYCTTNGVELVID